MDKMWTVKSLDFNWLLYICGHFVDETRIFHLYYIINKKTKNTLKREP